MFRMSLHLLRSVRCSSLSASVKPADKPNDCRAEGGVVVNVIAVLTTSYTSSRP